MIKVVNKRTYKGPGEYIGRPSSLGNPYSHQENTIAQFKVATRDDSIDKYDIWLDEQLKSDTAAKREFDRLVEIYKNTGELTLVCWCDPLRCHGHSIKKRIEEKCP